MLLLLSLIGAIGLVAGATVTRQTLAAGCPNTPQSRGCWGSGFNIDTNYETDFPVTGRIVRYTLNITRETYAPDGNPRSMILVNGQFPGPTIEADWGDTLEITVINNIPQNGTSIHWHGLRQLNSNIMDGVNGVTECPIPPGHEKIFTFNLTEYGTSWYHSHFSAQYLDGVLGGIQINGPATANYDEDLGVLSITDFYNRPYTQQVYYDDNVIVDIAPTGLINGTMVSTDFTKGSYNIVELEPGVKYRLRVVNTGGQDQFRVSLDNHTMTVIAADFVPIVPYTTDWLFVGIGQRYDVIIETNQEPSTYWFRSEAQICGSYPDASGNVIFTPLNTNNGNIKAIWAYKNRKPTLSSGFTGAPPDVALPNSIATNYTHDCYDNITIAPWVPMDVPSAQFDSNNATLDIIPLFNVTTIEGTNIFSWAFNNISFEADWSNPTLKQLADMRNDTQFPARRHVIDLPKANEWVYFIITSSGPSVGIYHPIHLHGHDFRVLGRGEQPFPGPSSLNFENPPRRDVTMVAGGGYTVIAWLTDNPGAWLLHCHIAFHAAEGLAVQFIERESEIPTAMDLGVIEPTCRNWATYNAQNVFKQGDSGV